MAKHPAKNIIIKQRNPKLAERCKKDFRHFLYIVWKHLSLPDPTPVQYDVAHFLQHGPKRMIIEGFRGVGKSWVTAAFVCWLLLCNPEEKILVVSASKQRSDDFSTFTLRFIKEIPILQHLTPLCGHHPQLLNLLTHYTICGTLIRVLRQWYAFASASKKRFASFLPQHAYGK